MCTSSCIFYESQIAPRGCSPSSCDSRLHVCGAAPVDQRTEYERGPGGFQSHIERVEEAYHVYLAVPARRGRGGSGTAESPSRDDAGGVGGRGGERELDADVPVQDLWRSHH